MESTSSSLACAPRGASPDDSWNCPICMDLLYKPCVNVCGHTFCFWCMHHAMNPFRPSQCPLCRTAYSHFPRVCLPLHYFLEASFPAQYAARSRENKELEARQGVESPEIPPAPPTPPTGPAATTSTPPVKANAAPAQGSRLGASAGAAEVLGSAGAPPWRGGQQAETEAEAGVGLPVGPEAWAPGRCACVLSGAGGASGAAGASGSAASAAAAASQQVVVAAGAAAAVLLHYRCSSPACGKLACRPCVLSCGCLVCEPCVPGRASSRRQQRQYDPRVTATQLSTAGAEGAARAHQSSQHAQHIPHTQHTQLQESVQVECPSCSRGCLSSARSCHKLEEALRWLYPEEYGRREQELKCAANAAAAAAQLSSPGGRLGPHGGSADIRGSGGLGRSGCSAGAGGGLAASSPSAGGGGGGGEAGDVEAGCSGSGSGGGRCERGRGSVGSGEGGLVGSSLQGPHGVSDDGGLASQDQNQQHGQRGMRPRSKLPRIDALIAAAAGASDAPSPQPSDTAVAAAGGMGASPGDPPAVGSGPRLLGPPRPARPSITDVWAALREELAANADTCFTWYSVGCDDCGVYPIVGRRYRCRDCSEQIGYDLCGSCFDLGGARPGRFNQAHQAHHRMEKVEPTGLQAAGEGPGGERGWSMLTLMNFLEVLHPELTVEQATSMALTNLSDVVLQLASAMGPPQPPTAAGENGTFFRFDARLGAGGAGTRAIIVIRSVDYAAGGGGGWIRRGVQVGSVAVSRAAAAAGEVQAAGESAAEPTGATEAAGAALTTAGIGAETGRRLLGWSWLGAGRRRGGGGSDSRGSDSRGSDGRVVMARQGGFTSLRFLRPRGNRGDRGSGSTPAAAPEAALFTSGGGGGIGGRDRGAGGAGRSSASSLPWLRRRQGGGGGGAGAGESSGGGGSTSCVVQ